jgi:hypothetical protein
MEGFKQVIIDEKRERTAVKIIQEVGVKKT